MSKMKRKITEEDLKDKDLPFACENCGNKPTTEDVLLHDVVCTICGETILAYTLDTALTLHKYETERDEAIKALGEEARLRGKAEFDRDEWKRLADWPDSSRIEAERKRAEKAETELADALARVNKFEATLSCEEPQAEVDQHKAWEKSYTTAGITRRAEKAEVERDAAIKALGDEARLRGTVEAERDALKHQLEHAAAWTAPIADAYDLQGQKWKDRAEKAEAEFGSFQRDISNAIKTTRFLDPPDGGDVSLPEQVNRMGDALAKAEAERNEAIQALSVEITTRIEAEAQLADALARVEELESIIEFIRVECDWEEYNPHGQCGGAGDNRIGEVCKKSPLRPHRRSR